MKDWRLYEKFAAQLMSEQSSNDTTSIGRKGELLGVSQNQFQQVHRIKLLGLPPFALIRIN
jgi:hypothetical protein